MSAKALDLARDSRALAFVYDRCATRDTTELERRLQACGEYVTAQGWGFGGWWVDEGDDALTNDRRPAFGYLLNTMRSAGADVPRVCLVYDWHRFSRDDAARGLLTRKVLHLGAWVETCSGEQRTPDGCYRHRGSLTAGPVTA